MKLIWASDVHLNFLDLSSRQQFYQKLKKVKGDNIIISGDIGESQNVHNYLKEIQEYTGKNLFFVLGNHDYYDSSLKKVRKEMEQYKNKIYYLPNGFVKLDDQTALVGVDGWGDGRNGDYEYSRLTMSDWLYIKELNKAYLKGREALLKALQEVADGDARELAKNVLEALKLPSIKRIIISTHVPPLEESCLYAGKKSTSDGLPFFSSQCLEKTIIPIVEKFPNIDFLWLSGHTHSRSFVQKRPNLVVKVAHSQYFHPQIEDIINV